MNLRKIIALMLSGTMLIQTLSPISAHAEGTEAGGIDLGNPVVRFDASVIDANDGDKLSVWENLASDDYDGIQNDVSKQPIYVATSSLNNKPAVKFEGNTFFEVANSNEFNWNEMSIFAVIRPEEIADNNDNNQIFSKLGYGGNWDHNWYFNINGGSKFNFGWKDEAGYHDFDGNTGITAGNNYVVAGVKREKTGIIYINGKKIGDMVSTAETIDCAHNDQFVYIGGNSNGAQSMKGEICEILAYDIGLSKTKIQEIQNYLGEKWGIDVSDQSIDLGNPIVQFDASAIDANDGDKLSTWENLASDDYDGVQNDDSKKPTYIAASDLNNKPAVKFEGNTFFEVANSKDFNWNEMSIFAVIRPEEISNNSDNNQIFSKLGYGGDWDHNWYFNINGDSKFNFGWKDEAGYHDFGGMTDISAKSNYLVAGVKNDKNGILYINGKKIGTLSSSAATNECTYNDQSVFIGGNPSCSQSMKGEICEIIAYNKGLSTDTMHDVQNYLADKWGIDLDISAQIKESGTMSIKVDGTEIREFSFNQEKYKRYLPAGTTKVPNVTAQLLYDSTEVETQVIQADTIPGTALIKVPEYAMEYKVEFLLMDKDVVSLKTPELNQVELTDGFWKDKIDLMQGTSVEYVLDELEKQGSITNYQNVINGVNQVNNFPWIDGLLCETIRAGADFMKSTPNAQLKAKIDSYIDVIYSASMTSENGYLSTHAMIEKPGQYFDATGNPRWYHDAYNFGCLVEAGVHYYDATGDPKLLYVAARFAEFMVDNYGYGTKANGEKKINMVPSHELPEEALLDMYKLLKGNQQLVNTLNSYSDRYPLDINPEDYGDLVQFWIENRGNYDNRVNGTNLGEYAQDHAYYFDQEQAVGHAVRANLYYAGIAAAGLEFNNNTYLATVDKIWHHIVEKQMYVTGGVGATGVDEAYGDDYYLPNDGYCETCAQVAMGYCSEYLLNAYGMSEYGDLVENYLYNGVLGGIGENGKTFYYTQPLNAMNHMRWDWEACPCCPPMLLKFYASIGKFIYSFNDTDTYVNQFISSKATLDNGVVICQTTDMPWEGTATFNISGKNTRLHIRIPEWENKAVTLKVNGDIVNYNMEDGFALLDVKAGDVVTLNMELEARRVYSDERVVENEGKVAIAYGPVVYCVESTDNGEVDGIEESDDTFALNSESEITSVYDASLLGGIVKLNTSFETSNNKQVRGSLIPFYARANRGSSSTYVWINESFSANAIRAKKWFAKASDTRDVGNSAAAAFDGNSDTYWAAGSNSFPQYLVVDLENTYTVNFVRTYFSSKQAWKFNVLYSTDGQDWKVFADESQNKNSTDVYEDTNEVQARYMAIEFTESGVGYIMIPEVEIYAKDSNENIALNKLCGATSTSNTADSAFALYDGNLYTRYCPSGEAKPQTVTMDMGAVADITGIDIIFEKETDWTYNVEYSEDGINWASYVSETFHGEQKVTEKDVRARYLKFNITATTGGVWASAWEFDVKVKESPKDIFTAIKECRIPQNPEEQKEVAVEINGCQISSLVGGYRVVYSVSDVNAEVEAAGLVYGLADYTTISDMVVGSTSETIYSYQATDAGKTSEVFSEMESAQSYVMTMRFIKNADFYDADINIRAYAKLKDGSYIYSDVVTCSVYDIADYLYKNYKMNTVESHNYLYNNILSVVNSKYSPIDYEWNDVIVKPEQIT